MTDHKVRIRMTMPKRNAAQLYRPVCHTCAERGPLTPSPVKADEWAEAHIKEFQ